MKHRFCIFLILILAAGSGQLYAQKLRLAEPKMGHTIFAQFFWANKDYYLSYDKLWCRKWQFLHFSTSIGYWYYSKPVPQSNKIKRSWEQKARLQFSVLAGKNGHYAVAGLTRYNELSNGVDPNNGPISIWENYYDYFHLGYRFQHPNGGVYFQLLLYPYLSQSIVSIIPYETVSIGLGITLPVKPKRPWYVPSSSTQNKSRDGSN